MAATLNGAAVLGLRLERPRIGVWHADVDVASATAPTGPVTLKVSDLLTLTGTVVNAGAFTDRVKVRMVGGAGGFDKPISARFYKSIAARVAVQEVLTAAGEKFDSTADLGSLSRTLTKWVRFSGTVESALGALIAKTGAAWRVLPTGGIWVGQETWPASTVPYLILTRDDECGSAQLAAEDPRIAPGTTIESGRKIERVVLTLTQTEARTEVWFQ